MKFLFFNRFSEKLTTTMKQFVFGSSSQNMFPSTFPNHRISSIESNRFKTCSKIRNNFLESRGDNISSNGVTKRLIGSSYRARIGRLGRLFAEEFKN